MNEQSSYKAKVSVGGATFEFEGPREYVEQQVQRVIESAGKIPPAIHPSPKRGRSRDAVNRQKVSRSGTRKAPSQPKMLGNLVNKDQVGNLKSFYTGKEPSSHVEVYAVLSYWLKDILGINQISIDEIWTLYKVIDKKPPRVLAQTFRDAKSKKGYFDVTDDGKYYLTTIGETFVEHDLPSRNKEVQE
ncbi:hypothetical protein F4X86_01460 [Candidatus Saccharibacteria bacterium]|nr:hypothetical protein [Candidatus Saccharibacteria bacterium]